MEIRFGKRGVLMKKKKQKKVKHRKRKEKDDEFYQQAQSQIAFLGIEKA